MSMVEILEGLIIFIKLAREVSSRMVVGKKWY
jgi:hypothetical protein